MLFHGLSQHTQFLLGFHKVSWQHQSTLLGCLFHVEQGKFFWYQYYKVASLLTDKLSYKFVFYTSQISPVLGQKEHLCVLLYKAAQMVPLKMMALGPFLALHLVLMAQEPVKENTSCKIMWNKPVSDVIKLSPGNGHWMHQSNNKQ